MLFSEYLYLKIFLEACPSPLPNSFLLPLSLCSIIIKLVKFARYYSQINSQIKFIAAKLFLLAYAVYTIDYGEYFKEGRFTEMYSITSK